MAGSPLELGFSAPSNSDTGDLLLDQPHTFTFGNKYAGAPEPEAPMIALAKQVAVGLVVALAARVIFDRVWK